MKVRASKESRVGRVDPILDTLLGNAPKSSTRCQLTHLKSALRKSVDFLP